MSWMPLRALLKRPGTSALAVVALALGIGLTTTMFSIIDGVFLRGLPFERADRILYVGSISTKQAGTSRPGAFTVNDYRDISAQQRSFEELAASARAGGARSDLIGPDGVPMRYDSVRLTPNALRVLRVNPIVGRGFDEVDARPGAARVVLIAESVWRAQFQADPQIAGRAIRLNGEPATIVGVMPSHFGFPQTEKVWMPLAIEAGTPRSAPSPQRVEAFGRLRNGVSVREAGAELAGIAASLANQFPENKDLGATAGPFVERYIPRRTTVTFTAMLAAVFGVLLIACVNVANLQLSRSAERTREVAIRLALGASRGRIVRQLLVEGMVLAAAGAMLGVVIARVGTTAVGAGITDPEKPFWITFQIDVRVLLFATALTAFAAIASSLLPALRVTRARPGDVLKDEGRASTSLRVGRASRVLVVAQIALSFALLIASGLTIKSIAKTTMTSFPFRTDLLVARLNFDRMAYPDDAVIRNTLDRIRERVAAASGVSAVTFATDVPGSGMGPIEIEGQPVTSTDQFAEPRAETLYVGHEYFTVMRLSVSRGRPLGPADRNGTDLVAVVSEDFVTRYFPGQDPIGRRVRFGRNPKTPPPWRTIVGVVPALGNLSNNSRAHNATALVPLDQSPQRSVDVVVASPGDPMAAAYAVRQAVAGVDDLKIAVERVNTVKGRYDERVWGYRVFGGLFSAFGVAALLLASAGLYGVMAFAVRRRTAEIGIRMALGADGGRILGMVLRQGAMMVLIGIVIGAGLGYVLSLQLTQLLFNVRPWDTVVFMTALAVLAGSGFLASFVPARRAAAVDPLVALRQE
jgi:putative ABC transport system permease protein